MKYAVSALMLLAGILGLALTGCYVIQQYGPDAVMPRWCHVTLLVSFMTAVLGHVGMAGSYRD